MVGSNPIVKMIVMDDCEFSWVAEMGMAMDVEVLIAVKSFACVRI